MQVETEWEVDQTSIGKPPVSEIEDKARYFIQEYGHATGCTRKASRFHPPGGGAGEGIGINY